MKTEGKSIIDWPDGERPREKLANLGADKLSSAELLAILLSSGTAKLNAVEIGKELLRKFQTLERLSAASLEEIKELEGIGQAKAVILQAAFQLSKNMHKQMAESQVIYFKCPEDVAKILPKMITEEKRSWTQS